MIISQTPLRISLCGGGTDFKEYYSQREGLVVSTAIDKYVFVIVKGRFDDLIYINYTKKEIVRNVDEIQHDLVREAAKKTGIKCGVEITMLADIPSEGSGLGSSSSLLVGLLNAFYNYNGILVTAEQLAQEACEIEIEILKQPIGKQDQYIAAYGGLCTFRFCKDGSVETEHLNISNEIKRKLGSNLALFYTNVTRRSSSILTEQKLNINKNIELHDKIKNMAFLTKEALLKGQIDWIGSLLSKNWEIKKELSSNITNCEIEAIYEKAISGGALGCKIAGAGGGGFLLSYCRLAEQDKLRKAMMGYREFPFMLESYGTKIIFDYRRYDWK
jgi:D-glycero-alpha-D-manno-heptose-7-phosphate kinase